MGENRGVCWFCTWCSGRDCSWFWWCWQWGWMWTDSSVERAASSRRLDSQQESEVWTRDGAILVVLHWAGYHEYFIRRRVIFSSQILIRSSTKKCCTVRGMYLGSSGCWARLDHCSMPLCIASHKPGGTRSPTHAAMAEA